MQYFPLFMDISGRRVVIVGGGEAASRKARLVVAAGADVEFIATTFEPELMAEWRARAVFLERAPVPGDFLGASMVFVALEDEASARAATAMAAAAGVPVNAVDRPHISSFITPSIVDRGSVVVAVSTGGSAPVLGRRLRARIEALAPSRLGALADFAASFRDAVAARIAAPLRRAFWERVLDGPIAAAVLSGDEVAARKAMIESLDRQEASSPACGVVHIVGAGPGDPELLTLRALRLLQDADVIFYDRLVSAEILSLSRRDAVRVFVGKERANHAEPQEEIHRRMIEEAQAGRVVVRLKGGDPFMFGRGGEELDALLAAGVNAFVTPGVTAAAGCAASVGMALTHRDHAQAVTFVTGHAKGDAEPDLDWNALAALGHTLVVYMGVAKSDLIARRLIAHGRSPLTPVAIIENGTRPDERTITGALGDLGALVEAARIDGPALLVIGEVAAFASRARSLVRAASIQRAVA